MGELPRFLGGFGKLSDLYLQRCWEIGELSNSTGELVKLKHQCLHRCSVTYHFRYIHGFQMLFHQRSNIMMLYSSLVVGSNFTHSLKNSNFTLVHVLLEHLKFL